MEKSSLDWELEIWVLVQAVPLTSHHTQELGFFFIPEAGVKTLNWDNIDKSTLKTAKGRSNKYIIIIIVHNCHLTTPNAFDKAPDTKKIHIFFPESVGGLPGLDNFLPACFLKKILSTGTQGNTSIVFGEVTAWHVDLKFMTKTQCFLWLFVFRFPGHSNAFWNANLQRSAKIIQGQQAGQASLQCMLPMLIHGHCWLNGVLLRIPSLTGLIFSRQGTSFSG